MRTLLAALITLSMLLLAACGTDSASPPDIRITQAWARPAPDSGRPSAAYFTLHNDGDSPDTLLAASTPAARAVELHESSSDVSGVMRMRPVEHVAIPPGDSVGFRPGSLHLMLIGLAQPLDSGMTVPLHLAFAIRDTVTVDVPVRQQP